MIKATSVISMGGYNTFCEILSLDKRALIVPRKTPRLEQSIRAEAAARLGLLRQLDGDNLDPSAARDPMVMARPSTTCRPAAALARLPAQPARRPRADRAADGALVRGRRAAAGRRRAVERVAIE